MASITGTMIVVHALFCNGEAPSTVFLGFIQPQRQTAEETVVGIGHMQGTSIWSKGETIAWAL